MSTQPEPPWDFASPPTRWDIAGGILAIFGALGFCGPTWWMKATKEAVVALVFAVAALVGVLGMLRRRRRARLGLALSPVRTGLYDRRSAMVSLLASIVVMLLAIWVFADEAPMAAWPHLRLNMAMYGGFALAFSIASFVALLLLAFGIDPPQRHGVAADVLILAFLTAATAAALAVSIVADRASSPGAFFALFLIALRSANRLWNRARGRMAGSGDSWEKYLLLLGLLLMAAIAGVLFLSDMGWFGLVLGVSIGAVVVGLALDARKTYGQRSSPPVDGP